MLRALKKIVAEVEAGRTTLQSIDTEAHYGPLFNGNLDYNGETWQIRLVRRA